MSQKKKILLIVAFVIIVAVGAVVALSTRQDGTDTGKKTTKTSQQNQLNASLLGDTFTDKQAGISMQIPKDWQLAPKNAEDPGSLTKFAKSGSGANGELIIRRTNANIDDIVRPYLEATRDIHITPTLVANEDVRIGNKVVRLLIQEMPGPNGVAGRIIQYIMYKDGTYYILNYTMLSSDYAAQKPALEESVKSLKFTAQ